MTLRKPAEVLDKHFLDRASISFDFDREVDFLVRAIKRSKSIFKPAVRPLGLASDRPYSGDLVFGLISRRIELNPKASPLVELGSFVPSLKMAGVEVPNYYRMLAPSDVSMIVAARKKLLKDVKSKCELGANFICVSELGYPAFKTPRDTTIDADGLKLLENGDNLFRKNIQRLSDKHDTIIICGTYHDVDCLNNKAVVFSPHTKEIEHEKLTTAKSENIGEVIRTPKNSNFYLYKTKYGIVAILICLDAFDLNMLCRQMTSSFHDSNEKAPDIIFVPAFSSYSLQKACEELSYFSRSIVCYVDGGTTPHSVVYVSGELHHITNLNEASLVNVTQNTIGDLYQKAFDRQKNGIFGSVYGSRTGWNP